MQSLDAQSLALIQLRETLERDGQPTTLSGKRYDQSHEFFERASNQQALILDFLRQLVSSSFANKPVLKILSVGSGSGILDNPFIESIAPLAGRVEYTAVDPNEVACLRFQRSFDELKLQNVHLRLLHDCVESLAPTDCFDIILVVHSLYYFADPAETLNALLAQRATQGRLVVIQAPEAELNRLAKCFWSHHVEDDIWFSDCVANHLVEQDIDFSQQRLDGKVNVAACLDPDDDEGELLMDFITQSRSGELKSNHVEMCREYLRAVGQHSTDRVVVDHPADVFVIADPREQA